MGRNLTVVELLTHGARITVKFHVSESSSLNLYFPIIDIPALAKSVKLRELICKVAMNWQNQFQVSASFTGITFISQYKLGYIFVTP